jgi:hypothetical protein
MKLSRLYIDQQVRIVSYEHAFCGEFGRVISTNEDGIVATVRMTRFPGRLVAVCADQMIDASAMIHPVDSKGRVA